MIREVSGAILRSSASALVNPVNTKGVMGAGLAKRWARWRYWDAQVKGYYMPGSE